MRNFMGFYLIPPIIVWNVLACFTCLWCCNWALCFALGLYGTVLVAILFTMIADNWFPKLFVFAFRLFPDFSLVTHLAQFFVIIQDPLGQRDFSLAAQSEVISHKGDERKWIYFWKFRMYNCWQMRTICRCRERQEPPALTWYYRANCNLQPPLT